MLRCELCREEQRLEVPLRFAPLIAFHTVIDHDLPVDGLSRIHRMVPRTGEAFWGLGSLRWKEGYLAFWRVVDRRRFHCADPHLSDVSDQWLNLRSAWKASSYPMKGQIAGVST